jgi:hypothetical protein
VKHFNSRKAITQADRRILAELLDDRFRNELRRTTDGDDLPPESPAIYGLKV